MRSLIISDIRNEIGRYMQLMEDKEPSESERKELDREQLKSDESLSNNRLESKTCINCGHSLPRNAKYCNDCGELQYRTSKE
jgi:ribosomal protein L40E